ncbi:MAG TPA: response regulator transcription factor [Candidatus Limnocylindrales bacterium]|nr:response regulator transcription factor [Candidatus Limnocylindrales bacterium]
MAPIRVLLVDDQALVRRGLRLILEAADDVTVVGEAADGQAALDAVERHDPDVVLMDIRMPTLDGITATRRLAARGRPQPRVLVLTTYDLDEYVYDALRAGASGFLLKDTPPEQLAPAIRVVAAGDALLAPSVTRRLIEAFARHPARAANATSEPTILTEREREVLRLLARGLSNNEIATRLSVSDTTVKTHLSNIFSKLTLRDRVQAVVYAYETGLVHPGDT